MTLEENVQQLRDALTVNTAMSLRHETRLIEHQQWLEDNESAYARHRIMMAEHAARMAEFGENMNRLEAAQRVNEEGLKELRETLRAFIDSMRKGVNGNS